jgi:polyhydroxybutyrate depolymerase
VAVRGSFAGKSPGVTRAVRVLIAVSSVLAALALLAVLVVVVDRGEDADDRGAPEPVPSAGCGSPAAASIRPEAQRIDLRSGDQRRWYLRQVPPAHDGRRPVPVVVDLHGYGEGAIGHAQSTQLGPLGAVEGFVTITPQGRGAPAAWDASPGSPDVAFLGDVLDQAERSLCVDTGRVFVSGASNGAMMAITLGCDAADRIAAVAAVAGVEVGDGCERDLGDRPLPIVAFHGTKDPTIRYDGGLDVAVAGLPLPDGAGTIGDIRPSPELSIPQVMAWWARQSGCDTSPSRRRVAADTVRLRFGCPEPAGIELYRIDGGGHTWPGRDIQGTGDTVVRPGPRSPLVTNELIWRFFEAHPLPG